PNAPINRRAALLQDLLRGIAALREVGMSSRARVLAEEALRIDPASADLRRAATELQRAADASADPTAFSRATTAAASAAIAEARVGLRADRSAKAFALLRRSSVSAVLLLEPSRSFEGRR